MSHYNFKLPQVKVIEMEPSPEVSSWVDAQNLPVYALCGKGCDLESTSPMGGTTELECKQADEGVAW